MPKGKIGISSTLGCLLFLSLFSLSAVAEESKNYRGIVSKNTDGDTIRFRRDHANENEKDWKIRMVGIDSPELHLPVPGRPPVGQSPWGEQAAKAMNDLAPVGTPVQLVVFGKDVHGRVLGRVEKQGKDLNLEMLEEGWAIPYIICEGESCDQDFFKRQDVSRYLQACEHARKQGRGIFNPRKKLKEMPFEFRLRMQERQPDKYVGDFTSRKLYQPSQYKKVDLCQRIFFMKKEDALQLGFTSVQ